MEGTITAFRGSYKTKYPNHMIVQPVGVENREKAEGLVGKKVEWHNPEGKDKKVISGKVSVAHGGKGALRVVFERGMPGQSLGTKVKIE